jgi:phospholipase D1/2
VHKFEKAGSKGKEVADSVAHHQMKWDGSLLDEPWSGTEDSERAAYVQEEL